jgi:hypothetical protein
MLFLLCETTAIIFFAEYRKVLITNFINSPMPHTGIAVPNCHFSADFSLSERVEPETSVSVYIVQSTGLWPVK